MKFSDPEILLELVRLVIGRMKHHICMHACLAVGFHSGCTIKFSLVSM